jgi:hypothetical protein
MFNTALFGFLCVQDHASPFSFETYRRRSRHTPCGCSRTCVSRHRSAMQRLQRVASHLQPQACAAADAPAVAAAPTAPESSIVRPSLRAAAVAAVRRRLTWRVARCVALACVRAGEPGPLERVGLP